MGEFFLRVLGVLFDFRPDPPITAWFSVTITVVALWYLYYGAKGGEARDFCARTAPATLTSLGILGTFLGVFYGLLDFDFNDKENSFPLLLEGLKVAFSTSVYGLSMALIFRVVYDLTSLHSKKKQEVSARDILEALKGIQLKIAGQEKDENNLLNEARLTRYQIARGFAEQKEAFEIFAKKVVETSIDQLVEALEEVVRDFNTKINEQFGENFKKLNEAVGKMVEWQENYRHQMEDMKRALDLAIEGIGKAEQSLSEISRSVATIPESTKRLDEIVRTISAQMDDLDRHLRAFAEVRDRATEALPIIQRNLEDITSGLRRTVEEQTAKLSDVVREQDRSAKEIAAGFERVRDSVNDSTRDIKDAVGKSMDVVKSSVEESMGGVKSSVDENLASIRNSIEQEQGQINIALEAFNTSVKASLSEQREEQSKMVANAREAFEEAISDSVKRLEKANQTFDDAMQKEIGRVVQEMIGRLEGVTRVFVDNYQELLNKAERMIEAAGRTHER